MKKFGILTAMKEEAELVIKKYKLEKDHSTDNISFYVNEDIVLVLCGIGKIQAGIGMSLLLERYSPQKCINIGIAGNGNKEKIRIGDVVLVASCYQHDVYLPFSGTHLDYLKSSIDIATSYENDINDDFNVISSGVCVTGDQFIDNQKKVDELRNIYNSDCIEMEAFGFLSAARELQYLENSIVIKGISDGADEGAKNDHEHNLSIAMSNSIIVLDNILQIGK